MVNKVILIGHLGKDPEIKRFEDNSVNARFTLATNESYLDKNGEWQEITDWHNIVMRGATGERAEKYLHKGSLIFLEGKIRNRKYNDSSGVERYITEVISSSFKLLNRKDSEAPPVRSDNDSKNLAANNTENRNLQNQNIDDQMDDLPF
jgi:single-strand DNA-binding protein